MLAPSLFVPKSQHPYHQVKDCTSRLIGRQSDYSKKPRFSNKDEIHCMKISGFRRLCLGWGFTRRSPTNQVSRIFRPTVCRRTLKIKFGKSCLGCRLRQQKAIWIQNFLLLLFENKSWSAKLLSIIAHDWVESCLMETEPAATCMEIQNTCNGISANELAEIQNAPHSPAPNSVFHRE